MGKPLSVQLNTIARHLNMLCPSILSGSAKCNVNLLFTKLLQHAGFLLSLFHPIRKYKRGTISIRICNTSLSAKLFKVDLLVLQIQLSTFKHLIFPRKSIFSYRQIHFFLNKIDSRLRLPFQLIYYFTAAYFCMTKSG